MGTRKTYSAEFKRQAIQLAMQPDHTLDEIARDLGMGRSTLSHWIRMAREHGELAFPGKGRGRLTPEQEELKRLRKENELLRQERDILKSAAVWFAKHSKRNLRSSTNAGTSFPSAPCVGCCRCRKVATWPFFRFAESR